MKKLTFLSLSAALSAIPIGTAGIVLGVTTWWQTLLALCAFCAYVVGYVTAETLLKTELAPKSNERPVRTHRRRLALHVRA